MFRWNNEKRKSTQLNDELFSICQFRLSRVNATNQMEWNDKSACVPLLK